MYIEEVIKMIQRKENDGDLPMSDVVSILGLKSATLIDKWMKEKGLVVVNDKVSTVSLIKLIQNDEDVQRVIKTMKVLDEREYIDLEFPEEVEVDKNIFEQFLDSFAEAFSKKTNWYRFGSSSGKVIIEGIMAGEFIDFIIKVEGFETLEKNIITLNPHLFENGATVLGRMTLFALDRYIFEYHKDVIDKAILKENELKTLPKPQKMQTKSYEYEGEEVVFFTFYQACHNETDIYAVPVEVAEKLNLEDYDGEEISRDSEFLYDIDPYMIEEDIIFKASCIKAYNYD